MEYFALYIILYLPLLIIGIVFLLKSLKRRNNIQIIIFSVCIIFCGYSILKSFANYISIQKEEEEYDKAALKTLPIGDITTIKGTIIFSKMDPYEKQDSMNEVYNDSLNRIYLVIPIKHFEAFEEESQIVKVSPVIFNSLMGYLNYEQQRRDNISYELQMKVKKIAQEFPNGQDYSNHWQLLELINVSKINKAPYPL